MNILLLGTAYPLRGGMAHFNALLSQCLTKRGHAVSVISFKRQYPSFLFPGKTQEESGEAGIPVDAESLIDSINPVNWISTGLSLRRREYDLIISTFWMPFFGPSFGTLCALLRWRKKNVRVISVLHNVVPHEHRIGDAVLTNFALRFSDAFIPLSESVESDLLKFFPAARFKRAALPIFEIFGSLLSKKKAREELSITDERVLLFFGLIRKYKGLHVLIDAMKEVNQRISCRLLIVGEYYGDEEEYRKHISAAGIDDVVTVVPEYIPNEKVNLYFSAADVIVQPYLSATQSAIAQIAYNFSKPIIATRVGALPEVIIDCKSGLIVPPNDPHALADAIVRFYEEKMETRLTEGAAEQRKKYSWDALADAVEELAGHS
jgi:glycosyltransferase involved in cell wall biosynthesis